MDQDKLWCSALGLTVLSHRRARDITHAELSGSVGLSISQLSMVERGRAATAITVLPRFAEAFGMTPLAFWAEVVETAEKLQGGAILPPSAIGRPKKQRVTKAKS